MVLRSGNPNPYNGIESDGGVVADRGYVYENPYNGIERTALTHVPLEIAYLTRIHTMELKGLVRLLWLVVVQGIHTMELKGHFRAAPNPSLKC